MTLLKYRKLLQILLLFLGIFTYAQEEEEEELKADSITAPYKVNKDDRSKLTLENPIQEEAIYDIETGKYIIYKKIGTTIIGEPLYLTPNEYTKYLAKKKQQKYYQEKLKSLEQTNENEELGLDFKNLLPSIKVNSKLFETIFGGDKIEFIPQGYASIDLGILYQKIDNPLIIPRNRTNFTINLQQRIQLSLLGKIGNNLQLKANYDTQAGFAFENRLNLQWKPADLLKAPNLPRGVKQGEDKIIRNIEFGNINMPLSTSLITGAQSLFGVKTDLQFGKTAVSAVFSEQQSEARNITIQDGGLVNTFKVNVLDYEENQSYFLSHYFEQNYDSWLSNYPLITSKINVIRMEVWKIDLGNAYLQNQRSIVAVRDLGESTDSSNTAPNNPLGNLFSTVSNIRNSSGGNSSLIENQLTSLTSNISPVGDQQYRNGEHFIVNRKVRKLNPSEYYFNPQLGFISLNQKLTNDQLLAVSFQYTKNDNPNVVYKVGEFSEESQDVLVTKLLKPNNSVDTSSPMWNLMMKNIYQLPASQFSQENFFLNVFFRDESGAKLNYLPDVSKDPLIRFLNWDRLNLNNDSTQGGDGDGIFDFVPGITVFPESGKIIHTKTKPYFTNLPTKYQFEDLYTKLKSEAQNNALASRYSIEGRYTGQTGDGIPLGSINVPRGSVKVTANGQQLTEGVDYTVDYQLGRVKIINQTLKDSGVPINVSLENQSTFNIQKKRFWGINVEHKFSDKFNIGATYLNYKERPLTQKANYGVEPVNNSIIGMNLQYQNDAPFLTRLTDKIPGIQTDAPSSINIQAEAAYLIPGINSASQNQSYIDDFEETSSKISLKDPNSWSLASKPTNFGTSDNTNDLNYGNYRALSSWYFIDSRFYGVGGSAPSGISNNSVSKHSTRRVGVSEIFNRRDLIAGEQLYMNTLDYTMYPQERGPYNLNTISENPADRWSGIMRSINVTNFVQANIEYVEFWLMDPYADGNSLGANPTLKLHLGNVSEDVLKDGNQQYENGLPDDDNPAIETTETNWGKQPKNPAIVYSFSSDGQNRTQQDTGLDGLNNAEEITKYGVFPDKPDDPSADDFVYYLDDSFDSESDVLNRYRYFRNPQGNSPAGSLNSSTQAPDVEDLNNDFNLDTSETYNEYEIPLKPSDISLGVNNIVDEKEVEVTFENGNIGKVKWYLYRIPVNNYTTTVPTNANGEQILNNVRFIRMITQGFENTSTLRFGTLDLVRADWRRYDREIASNTTGSEGFTEINNSNLEIGAVNLEENSLGRPPYMLPPGIIREELSGTGGLQSQNEASLFLKVNNLEQNNPRGLFKYINMDMRRYKKLKLFVSAQNTSEPNSNLYDENAKFFIRIGSDLSENYYEYEMSLKYTSQNDNSSFAIWPEENTVDLELQKLVDAKKQRDAQAYTISDRYEFNLNDTNKKIFVKGRPSIGNVTSVMMGVRNTGSSSKNLILWINELRLGEINSSDGGYATNTNLTFNLADFAQINANAQMSTAGFGALDSKPTERSQEDTKQYAVNANVNLDKFIPEKVGLKIPVTVTYGEKFVDPKYDPINNDIEFKDAPNKDQLKQAVRTYSETRAIGINGLRKEKTSNNPQRFYDIENLTASFQYSDLYYRDIYTVQNITQNLNASLDYNYAFKPLNIEPFKKSKLFEKKFSKKYLQLIQNLNFNPAPARFSFRTDIQRLYNQFELRDINALLSGTEAQSQNIIFNNNFFFGWQYNLGFNLTKSLKLDINSNTRTLVDQLNPNGIANSKLIWNDLLTAGRPVLYNHKIQVNYHVPTQYIPFLDFTNVDLGYSANYNWQARSTTLTRGSENLGNIAQNSNTKTLNASLDFNRFFKRFRAFNKVDSIANGRKQQRDSILKVYETNFEKGIPNKKFNFKYKYKLKHYPVLVLKSIKRAQLNYNENNGTMLPGYLARPDFFGRGTLYGQSYGPTTGFLFGSQVDIRKKAIENGWITSSDLLNEPFAQTHNQQLSGNIQIEPNSNFKIDLNFTRNFQHTLSQSQYNLNTEIAPFENISETYSTSIITLPTSFSAPEDIYKSLIDNSFIVSRKLGNSFIDNDGDGYNDGYSLTSADVLIPSFISAYTGENANNTKLNYKRNIPLPNWNITYSGLSSIPWIARKFQRIDLTHSYVSTYAVSGVQANLNYYNAQLPTSQPDPTNPTTLNHLKDQNGNFYVKNIYGAITMLEGFNPLIGIDVTMRNSMQLRFQYNRDRLTTLSMSNFTLNEELGNEFIFGFGYVLKDLIFNINYKGNPREIKSDLNIRADISLRDTQTRLRRIIEEDNQITGGQNILSVRFSADYNFSKNLNLKLFYDQNMTKYKISTAYPLNTVRAGISATFKFGN
ncbi:MAG: cell surface protein SprA [Flavobacteriales bacterium]|nr:cell surface protein SprA [Flavobacteriales bacterium]